MTPHQVRQDAIALEAYLRRAPCRESIRVDIAGHPGESVRWVDTPDGGWRLVHFIAPWAEAGEPLAGAWIRPRTLMRAAAALPALLRQAGELASKLADILGDDYPRGDKSAFPAPDEASEDGV